MNLKEKQNFKVSYYGASDIGLVRSENQDSLGKFPADNSDIYQPKGVLFIVADGMGGHSGGKDASQTAVDIVGSEYFNSSSEVITTALLYAFKSANLKINQSSADVPQFQKKGTTCSALVLQNNSAHIAHVGDSRIYKISDGEIVQLTNDHTEVSEMFRKGILSEEEMKNHPSKSVLVRAMGIEPDIEVDLIDDISLSDGDIFVLCSDGLAKVETGEIKETVINNDPEDACNKLVSLANDAGGKDNVTVQVIKINSGREEESFNPVPVRKKKNKSWQWIILALLILAALVILGLTYRLEIMEMFSAKPPSSESSEIPSDEMQQNDPVDKLLEDANDYLAAGNLESALALYNEILNNNPMHISALNGRELIRLMYVQKGDKSLIAKNSDDAFNYYRKAFEINPDDKEINNKLLQFQNKKPDELKSGVQTIDNRKPVMNDEKENPVTNMSSPEEEVIPETDISEWISDGLTEKDFSSAENRFTFLETGKLKKIIYKQPVEDIDIEVDLKFKESHVTQKAGIIIGYNKAETHKENYFAFIADNYGNFTLVRLLDGKEEKLLSAKRQISTGMNNISLKLKSLGPWIMLYHDEKLLDSYLNKDFIKGRIGLFSESNTHSEFSGLKISSAFEK